MKPEQYEIILVNLDPTVGSEIRKTRPCVVISPNEMNRHLNTLVIAPLTSASRNYPTRIKINGTQVSGWIVIDQIRTIDRQRVIKTLGMLKEKDILRVKAVLRETFVD